VSVPDTNSENTWTRANRFLGLLLANLLQLPIGAAVGRVLSCNDVAGNVAWTATLPATTVALTGQTISQVGELVGAATGEYLVSIYLQCTTAGAAGTLDVTLSHIDDIGARTTAILATILLTGTNRDEAVTVVRCASGAIEYTRTVTGAVGGPIFSAHFSASRVR